MSKSLSLADIDESARSKVYTQDYAPKTLIDGVKVVSLRNFAGEEGAFCELMRLDESGLCKEFPGFSVRQINWSSQFPGSVKAWHMHLSQDEVWYVPAESHLVAGLWDVRKGSKTFGKTNRIVLGRDTNRLLFIPRGVAHGSANFSKNLGIILYFMNSQFDVSKPDEQRIPWDSLGQDFWKPERD